jgi:hypothetical protein
MERPGFSEPESMREVRRWKEAASQELAVLGFEEFHRRASEEFADLHKRIEAKQRARLAK